MAYAENWPHKPLIADCITYALMVCAMMIVNHTTAAINRFPCIIIEPLMVAFSLCVLAQTRPSSVILSCTNIAIYLGIDYSLLIYNCWRRTELQKLNARIRELNGANEAVWGELTEIEQELVDWRDQVSYEINTLQVKQNYRGKAPQFLRSSRAMRRIGHEIGPHRHRPSLWGFLWRAFCEWRSL